LPDIPVATDHNWFSQSHRRQSTTGSFQSLQQRTKFRKDRLNRYGYIAIFVIFNMAAAAILNFQKFEILTAFAL